MEFFGDLGKFVFSNVAAGLALGSGSTEPHPVCLLSHGRSELLRRCLILAFATSAAPMTADVLSPIGRGLPSPAPAGIWSGFFGPSFWMGKCQRPRCIGSAAEHSGSE
jgi:hypothetical protein